MSSRPPIDAAALRTAIGTRWSRVDVVGSTTSTNADLLADAAAPDRAVRAAELQTAGRGRLDRAWTSPEGAGLTFSVLVRPAVPVAHWGWLPLLAGVALHDAVAVLVPCVLKWPNDLLAGADEAKLAGVLAQTSDAAVVIGIGLNVTTARTDLPEHATSLALCGASADRTTLLATILLELADRYDAWTASDGDAEACGLAAAYRAACSTLGREVTVEAPGAVVRGRGVEVDPTGRLVIEVGGDRRAVAAGDVTHVR